MLPLMARLPYTNIYGLSDILKKLKKINFCVGPNLYPLFFICTQMMTVHWWVRIFGMHVIFAEKITIQMSSVDLELYVH